MRYIIQFKDGKYLSVCGKKAACIDDAWEIYYKTTAESYCSVIYSGCRILEIISDEDPIGIK